MPNNFLFIREAWQWHPSPLIIGTKKVYNNALSWWANLKWRLGSVWVGMSWMNMRPEWKRYSPPSRSPEYSRSQFLRSPEIHIRVTLKYFGLIINRSFKGYHNIISSIPNKQQSKPQDHEKIYRTQKQGLNLKNLFFWEIQMVLFCALTKQDNSSLSYHVCIR